MGCCSAVICEHQVKRRVGERTHHGAGEGMVRAGSCPVGPVEDGHVDRARVNNTGRLSCQGATGIKPVRRMLASETRKVEGGGVHSH